MSNNILKYKIPKIVYAQEKLNPPKILNIQSYHSLLSHILRDWFQFLICFPFCLPIGLPPVVELDLRCVGFLGWVLGQLIIAESLNLHSTLSFLLTLLARTLTISLIVLRLRVTQKPLLTTHSSPLTRSWNFRIAHIISLLHINKCCPKCLLHI